LSDHFEELDQASVQEGTGSEVSLDSKRAQLMPVRNKSQRFELTH